jgi:hypothetical protein
VVRIRIRIRIELNCWIRIRIESIRIHNPAIRYRRYVNNIDCVQGDVTLPDGPLFLNPESLIHAFRKEVIDRNPEEFKIRSAAFYLSFFAYRYAP